MSSITYWTLVHLIIVTEPPHARTRRHREQTPESRLSCPPLSGHCFSFVCFLLLSVPASVLCLLLCLSLICPCMFMSLSVLVSLSVSDSVSGCVRSYLSVYLCVCVCVRVSVSVCLYRYLHLCLCQCLFCLRLCLRLCLCLCLGLLVLSNCILVCLCLSLAFSPSLCLAGGQTFDFIAVCVFHWQMSTMKATIFHTALNRQSGAREQTGLSIASPTSISIFIAAFTIHHWQLYRQRLPAIWICTSCPEFCVSTVCTSIQYDIILITLMPYHYKCDYTRMILRLCGMISPWIYTIQR